MKHLARQLLRKAFEGYARIDSSSPCDAIAILGCTLLPGGMPTRALRERLDAGIALFRSGRAPLILVSGGRAWHGHIEAETMRDQLLRRGVPETSLVVERESRNTRDNARLGAALLRAKGAESALVVTQPLHLPRALRAFRTAGIDARGVLIEESYQLDLEDPLSLVRDLSRELAATTADLLLPPLPRR